ncbi:MAG: TolC family protein [Deltaproteobacteria bacterium]|nr:TolC family protein [Deltaproteobacteria bacterium]MBN2674755.1 TolC family protein [Deltaproteobacteria bacterium]
MTIKLMGAPFAVCTAWALLAGACATTSETASKKAVQSHSENVAFTEHPRIDGSSTELNGTLQRYVAYAMENSKTLEAQFNRWKAGVYRISRARRLPDPVISYAFYISQVETRVGPQRQKVSIRQTFPWPTRLSAGADAASARSKSQQKQFDALAISIATSVEQIYWRLWEIRESIQVQKTHETVLAGLSESANALLATGRIDLSDQQQIDLTRARVADSISKLDEQQIQKEAELRALIAAPPKTPIPITSKPNLNPVVLDEEALLTGVKTHPSLQKYMELARSSSLEARREATERYPDFTIGLDWIETGDAQAPATPDSGKDALIAGISVSIPLWQRNVQQSVDAFHADEQAYVADGQAATDLAVSAYYQTLSRVRDAERRIALYEKTLVPQAETVFESVLGAYVGGRGSAASTLLAQQDLLALRLQLISAQADYLTQIAALKNLVGRELSDVRPERSIQKGDTP